VSVYAAVRPTRSTRSIGWVPFALVALVVIPAIAGSLRLVELAGGDQLLPANPRITASPVPVVVHILCAVAYAILGAFQFSGALRRRWPGWHRVAGRVLVVLGNAVFGISELNTALGLGAGWGINLAVVEYVIRRRISTRGAGRAKRVAAAAWIARIGASCRLLSGESARHELSGATKFPRRSLRRTEPGGAAQRLATMRPQR
jgi:uncharacterized membrane protein